MAGEGIGPVLTERQLQVVRLVARGEANKQIAAALSISERAVEATLTRVYERLGVSSRSGLIAVALSEAGFGLAMERRTAPPSAVGALGAQRSLDEEAVAGRSAESLVGRTVREAYPDLDPNFLAALDQTYRSGRPWASAAPAPARWTHEDGSTRESRVNLIFQPLRDATGAVVGLLQIGAEEPGQLKS